MTTIFAHIYTLIELALLYAIYHRLNVLINKYDARHSSKVPNNDIIKPIKPRVPVSITSPYERAKRKQEQESANIKNNR